MTVNNGVTGVFPRRIDPRAPAPDRTIPAPASRRRASIRKQPPIPAQPRPAPLDTASEDGAEGAAKIPELHGARSKGWLSGHIYAYCNISTPKSMGHGDMGH